MNFSKHLGVVAAFLFLSFNTNSVIPAFAGDSTPNCIIDGQAVPVDNGQVLEWKKGTKNQFKARGYVRGEVTRSFGRKGDHDHFEIRIGNNPKDTIEVVYNNKFGGLPEIQSGMEVEACGDYVTSYAKAGGYEASPSKAIIHWVHQNERNDSHEDGFLIIDGNLYGYSGDHSRDNFSHQGRRKHPKRRSEIELELIH